MSSIRLSCSQCQARKRKCDKRIPCSSCKAAGRGGDCAVVERKRLPRGKSGAVGKRKDEELTARVDRLQEMLERVVTRTGPDKNAVKQQGVREKGRLDAGFGSMVAPEFWQSLVDEVAGIRETIDEKSSDGPEDESSDGSGLPTLPMVAFGHGIQTIATGREHVPKAMEDALLDFYRDRVDTVFKTLHWPTTSAMFDEMSQSSAGSMNSALALKAAVSFMGLCSARREECELYFYDSKPTLLSHLQVHVEMALVRARVMQTPDILGLQAFVVYLQALRTKGAYASSWTLLAVAVRLAGALRLGEDTIECSRFELEIRRRLWYSICLMDTQAMLDRGSPPLIPIESIGRAPLDADDSAITPGFVRETSDAALTDSSFAAMTHEAMLCQRRMTAAEERGGWKGKQDLFSTFEKHCEAKYGSISWYSTAPLHRLMKGAVQSILNTMRLLLRRPPYRQTASCKPPEDDLDVLELSIHALESHLGLQIDELSPWAWKRWTPWYALAVVLAELTRRPYGESWERGFDAAFKTFRTDAPPPTDPESGPLWRPIARLLKQVEKLRRSYLATKYDTERQIRDAQASALYNMSLELTQDDSLTTDLAPPNASLYMPPSGTTAYYQEMTSVPASTATAFIGTQDEICCPSSFEEDISWLDWDQVMQGQWDQPLEWEHLLQDDGNL